MLKHSRAGWWERIGEGGRKRGRREEGKREGRRGRGGGREEKGGGGCLVSAAPNLTARAQAFSSRMAGENRRGEVRRGAWRGGGVWIGVGGGVEKRGWDRGERGGAGLGGGEKVGRGA